MKTLKTHLKTLKTHLKTLKTHLKTLKTLKTRVKTPSTNMKTGRKHPHQGGIPCYERLSRSRRGDRSGDGSSTRIGRYSRGRYSRGRSCLTSFRLQAAPEKQLSSCVRVSRSCVEDEGRPLGIGLHEQMPNRLERLYSKGWGRERQGAVPSEEMNASEPLTKCR